MRWRMDRKNNGVGDRPNTARWRIFALAGGCGVLVLAALVIGREGASLRQWWYGQADNLALDSQESQSPSEYNQRTSFVSAVLADTEEQWSLIFQELGGNYQTPSPVLFSESIDAACGFSKPAMGSFYCLDDETVYIDLNFYEDLKQQYPNLGDDAQAYVIARQIGHHVQHLTGILENVQQLQQQVSAVEADQLSVRLELQADCFAGVWAHHANQTPQISAIRKIEDVVDAASAIGGDRLQQEARGYIIPDSLTHGTLEQRKRWLRVGIETGDMHKCDTFSSSNV